MKKIELTRLCQLAYMAAKVERYKIHDVRASNHEDDDYEAYANGNALLISGDIEVFFFWRAKSDYGNFATAPEYQIEIDDSGMISADINRKIIDDKGKELDQLSADTILVSLIKQHIGWITAIDNELTKPRLELIKSTA